MPKIDTPPDSIRARLAWVAEECGRTVEQIWIGQSKATKLAVFGGLWRKFWAGLTRRKKAALRNNWAFWGRKNQQFPLLPYFVWLILAGRGWGKSHTGAQWAIHQARTRPGSIGCLLAATSADLRDTMIHGDSGILALSPPDFVPTWHASKCWLTWPNGSRAIGRTAEKPDRVRGPNLDWAWVDELAAFRFVSQAWDMLMLCMRKGINPQVCVTTTPRPLPLVLELAKRAAEVGGDVVMTRGPSWDNYWILSRSWFLSVVAKMSGALRRQEIDAEILDKIEGALWSHEQIWQYEVESIPADLERVVVAVDPSEEDGPDNDECGIVVAGRDAKGHGYVMDDLSQVSAPAVWARAAYEAFLRYDADAIVVETNRGGKMCAAVIRSVVRPDEPRPRIIEVKATKGKRTRAEPWSALWSEGRWHMVGKFAKLENEMATYVPGVSPRSPNRLDAAVWAAAHLFPFGRVS